MEEVKVSERLKSSNRHYNIFAGSSEQLPQKEKNKVVNQTEEKD